jgi:hypothetical protein
MRLRPVSPYVGLSPKCTSASERRNRKKAEFRPRPFFSILLVLLGHKSRQISNIDAIDLNAYSIE